MRSFSFLFTALLFIAMAVISKAADNEPLFLILDDGNTNGVAPRACVLGDTVAAKRGILGFSFQNSSGGAAMPILGAASGSVPSQITDAAGAVVGPLMTISGVNYLPVAPPIDITSSTLNVTTQDIGSATTTGYGGQGFILGTPTAGSTATMTLNSIQTVMVVIQGIWTGTLSIEVSVNGGTIWVPRAVHVVGTAIYSSSVTANVAGSLNASAKTNVRVRATSAMTGTATVNFIVSDNPSNIYVANAIKLLDGSSPTSTTQMDIKPASTAALATDTSVVVGLSPNSSLPTGTNTIGSLTNITGTISLPTGAATAALQTTGNTALTSIQSTSNSTAVNTNTIAGNQTNGTQRTLVTDLVGNLQPSGDAPARTIYVRENDGTNSTSVKAASTQSALTDTALVVTGRPDNVGTPNQTSVSCAATSTTLLAASTATMFLSIRNPTTATATIWINTAGVAAVAAAPSIDLPPGAEADFFAEGASFLPTSQINCISGGSASTVTVTYK